MKKIEDGELFEVGGYPKKPPLSPSLLILRYIVDHPGCTVVQIGEALRPDAKPASRRAWVTKHIHLGLHRWVRRTLDLPMKHYITPEGLERLAADETPCGDVGKALSAMVSAGWIEMTGEPGVFQIAAPRRIT